VLQAGEFALIWQGMSLERVLLSAQGYIELEMPDEALREIDALSPKDQLREEVLQMRLFVVMRAKRWEQALSVCARLRAISPAGATGYIHGAFCLHEMGRTLEAKQLLLEGPASLLSEPTYHYNLGCYDAVLGNLDEAAQHLETSFQMDKKFREIAKYDPDLKAVHGILEK
jgi:tetratricopeptide (TPR) repeat protein